MNDSDKHTDRIHAQVIDFPAPGQARLLIGADSVVLDGGVTVDVPMAIIPRNLQVDGQMVIAVFDKQTCEILAVEPIT